MKETAKPVFVQQVKAEDFYVCDWTAARCNLHTRESERSSSVVIFVHGWSGDGYGAFASFPKLLFEGDIADPIDVAIFDYLSGTKRFFHRGCNVQDQISRLLICIEEIAQLYETIHLVCHSMGGIIAQGAAVEYLQRQIGGRPEQSPVVPVASVILFGSPLAGTVWASRTLARFFRERSWLQPLSKRRTATRQFIIDHVETHAVASVGGGRTYLLPMFAWRGDQDSIVQSESAFADVPSRQIGTLVGSHTSIAKPGPDDHPQVDVALQQFAEVNQLRTAIRNSWMRRNRESSIPGRSMMQTEMSAGPGGMSWMHAYTRALRSASSKSMLVTDVRDLDPGLSKTPALLVSVHSSLKVVNSDETEKQLTLNARARHDDDPRLTVSLFNVGDPSDAACVMVENWVLAVGPLDGRFFIAPCSDNEELYKSILGAMNSMVSRVLASIYSASRLDRVTEESAPAEDFFDERRL